VRFREARLESDLEYSREGLLWLPEPFTDRLSRLLDMALLNQLF